MKMGTITLCHLLSDEQNLQLQFPACRFDFQRPTANSTLSLPRAAGTVLFFTVESTFVSRICRGRAAIIDQQASALLITCRRSRSMRPRLTSFAEARAPSTELSPLFHAFHAYSDADVNRRPWVFQSGNTVGIN